jgi:hypothetical protein
VATGAPPGPLSHFVAHLDQLRTGSVPDMDVIGRLLAELTADEEYLAPLDTTPARERGRPSRPAILASPTGHRRSARNE